MSDTKVVIGKFSKDIRFSYAQVFTPRAMQEGQKEKYSVSIIIPKSAKKEMAAIEKAIKAATDLGKSTKFGGKIPNPLKTPVRDGDEERPDDEAYADSWFINASSLRAPSVVDASVTPILDQEEFYSGVYGRVTVNFYAYNVNVNKGIAAGLNNIQKTRDGERLGAALSTAEDDFGEFGTDDGDSMMK